MALLPTSGAPSMPLYEYRCRNCDHQFEIQQSFSDEPLTECPECVGALRKVFNPVGISFRGSGFYKNDSRGSSGSSDTSGSNGSDATPSSSDSSSGASESTTSGSKTSDSTPPAATTSTTTTD